MWYWLRTSKSKFSAQGDLFAPERQRVRNKRQEIEDEEERGPGYLSQGAASGQRGDSRGL